MSRSKKILEIIYNNLIQIFNGSILFLLSFSGLICAFILRNFDYNGAIIASFGILIESVAIFICYLFFKRYFKKEEAKAPSESKGKKK